MIVTNVVINFSFLHSTKVNQPQARRPSNAPYYPKMKFSAAIISLSFLYGTSAFAPNSRVGISTTAPTALNKDFAPIGSRSATDASSTELGLFFMNTMKRRSEAKKAGNAKTGDAITEKEVRALFDLWNSALATGDSRIVANRYAKNPVLLPTVSDEPRTDFDSVKDYFDSFLLKKPQGKILDGQIHIGDGWASDMGIYEFTMGATGDKVKARYTYNYIKGKNRKSLRVHSSLSIMKRTRPTTDLHNRKHLLQLLSRGRHMEDPAPPFQCAA